MDYFIVMASEWANLKGSLSNGRKRTMLWLELSSHKQSTRYLEKIMVDLPKDQSYR